MNTSQFTLLDSLIKRNEPWEQADLSLSEDDEGARFAGAGLGFRARDFGAGFSADENKIEKYSEHFHEKKRE